MGAREPIRIRSRVDSGDTSRDSAADAPWHFYKSQDLDSSVVPINARTFETESVASLCCHLFYRPRADG